MIEFKPSYADGMMVLSWITAGGYPGDGDSTSSGAGRNGYHMRLLNLLEAVRAELGDSEVGTFYRLYRPAEPVVQQVRAHWRSAQRISP